MTGFTSLFAALTCFVVCFPSLKAAACTALLASAGYFTYYLLFDRICKTCYYEIGVTVSVLGVLLLTLVVHLTGGIVSPLIFFYFCILISEALYGLENPITLPVSLAGYLLVVAGQFSGFLPQTNSRASEVYGSLPATLLIAAVTAFYLAQTRSTVHRIIDNLRAKLEREGAEKEVLLRKFSELNSATPIGVIAHRIAHDLRGPLSCISGYIQCEMAKVKTPEDTELLEDLNSTVTGMAESLHAITRFGKPGGPACEKIPLSDFMHNLLAIIAFSPQAKGVKFETSAPESKDLSVNASRIDLQQAYFNIIKNAVEAVGGNTGGKKIEIAIEREGKEVRVSISDNGPGIPEEVLKTLFNNSVTTKKDGTGVGLLITRDLLMRNDGGIKLHNREGGGLAVITSIPAA